MRARRPITVVLFLSLLAFGAAASGDDESPAPPADEENVETALPPPKKVDGEPQAFRVSENGSVIVVGFETGKAKAAVWAFPSDSTEGRELGNVVGWVRRLTITPNGKWVLVESLTPQRGRNVDKVEIMNVEDPARGYTIPGSEGADADIDWAYPGSGPDEVDAHGREEIRVWDLRKRKIVRRMSKYDHHDTVLSADGSVTATERIYDVVVNDANTGEVLFELLSEVPGKKKKLGYRLGGLSGDGAYLVVHARDRASDKKSWIEGYRVSDGKRRWKANLSTYSWMVLVGPTRVAALVKGRVKMLDVENGRPKVAENTSKKVEYLESGPGGHYFWAATKDGHLIPVR